MEPNENSPVTVFVQPIVLQLLDDDGSERLVEAELRYDDCDPYAVSLVVTDVSTPVPWTFARELLTEGIDEPAGDGDVHVWPGCSDQGSPLVFIELTPPEEDVIFAAFPLDVEAFLAVSYQMVAAGEESRHVDVDAAIAAILEATSQDRVDE